MGLATFFFLFFFNPLPPPPSTIKDYKTGTEARFVSDFQPPIISSGNLSLSGRKENLSVGFVSPRQSHGT